MPRAIAHLNPQLRLIDDALTYLELCEIRVDGPTYEGTANWHALPRSTWDRALVFQATEDDDEPRYFGIATRTAAAEVLRAMPRFDITTALLRSARVGSEWQFSRIRNLKRSAVRGRLSGGNPFEVCILQVNRDGSRAEPSRFYVDVSTRLVWNGRTTYGDEPEIDDGTLSDRIAIAASVALTSRYDWSVCLGYENWSSVRFACHRNATKEIFRLRDIPPGRNRREALRNWVEAYWRRRPGTQAEDDPEVEVVKHLRGVERFTWNGLNVEIIPSTYALELAARLQQERKER